MATTTGIEVRLIDLPSMWVAAARGFGTSPELEAWSKLARWVEREGILSDGHTHQFFGFNNPDPTPGDPNYGYEQWITVGPEAQPSDEIEIKDVEGGRYAVARCTLDRIGAAWRDLVQWTEESAHRMADRQCLEECIIPPGAGMPAPSGTTTFDLYLAVEN